MEEIKICFEVLAAIIWRNSGFVILSAPIAVIVLKILKIQTHKGE